MRQETEVPGRKSASHRPCPTPQAPQPVGSGWCQRAGSRVGQITCRWATSRICDFLRLEPQFPCLMKGLLTAPSLILPYG